MKIVHLCDYPLSLAPYRLCKIQQKAGMDARLIGFTDHYDPQNRLPYDVLFNESFSLTNQLLEEAEVIHYHNCWKNAKLFQAHPQLWDLVKKKKSVIQFHSYRYKEFEEALQSPSLIKLVIAQYHVRLYPECIPVQNAVPIYDDLHSPNWIYNEVPQVAFTPAHCREGQFWERKGCKETLKVLEGKFQHQFLTGVQWQDTMVIRKSCDIAIDEIITGSYHMCSLEALSLGLVAIANLDDKCIDALEKVTGTRKHPWVIASAQTLEQKLTELIQDKAYLKNKRLESRSYMEKYWNPTVLANKFRDIYWQG